MFECLEDCGESTECSSSCYRGNIVCVDACPCHTDCPMGCKQCKNPVCKEQLALIIHNRPSTANLEFKPMLFDFQGKKINFNFEVEKDALVWENSCGAWFNGEYHIITGKRKDGIDLKIISKIDGCSLKKIGELPFNIDRGVRCIGVPSSAKSSDKIFLLDTDDCRDDSKAAIYDGETWRDTNLPQYIYDYDSANMALYNGNPLIIGASEEYPLAQLDDPSSWRS